MRLSDGAVVRFPAVMGVLNVTPDSFSDGGRYVDAANAQAHAIAMARSGADIIDIGGESTRPGAPEVSADEEISRVIPVIRALRGLVARPISIDTRKASVARAALAQGASAAFLSTLASARLLRRTPRRATLLAAAAYRVMLAVLVLRRLRGAHNRCR